MFIWPFFCQHTFVLCILSAHGMASQGAAALDANFQPQSWLNIEGTWRCKGYVSLVIDRRTPLLPVRCFLGVFCVRFVFLPPPVYHHPSRRAPFPNRDVCSTGMGQTRREQADTLMLAWAGNGRALRGGVMMLFLFLKTPIDGKVATTRCNCNGL